MKNNQNYTRNHAVAQIVLGVTKATLMEEQSTWALNSISDITIRIIRTAGLTQYSLTDGNETFHTNSFMEANIALANALQ